MLILPHRAAASLPSLAHPGVPLRPPLCTAGKYVELKDTIDGFKGVLEGKYDDLPEMAFYMVGPLTGARPTPDALRCGRAACSGCSLCGARLARPQLLVGCMPEALAGAAVEWGVDLTPVKHSCACAWLIRSAPRARAVQNGDIREVADKADKMAAEIAGKA